MTSVAGLLSGGDREAAAATLVRTRQGEIGAAALLEIARESGESERRWALFGLGLLGEATVMAAARGDLEAEFQQALEPIWLGRGSWLKDEAMTLLQFIDKQQVPPLVPQGRSEP